MPLNRYRVFSKIAETGNMRKAADELKYTQQAVSRIIKCMEEDYGFPLFKRFRDGVTLTPEAEKILPEINLMIEQEDSLLYKVENIQSANGLVKQLHVGACGSIVMGVMNNVLETLDEEHPELSVGVMYDACDSTTIADLKSGKLDCALMVEGCQEDMDFEPLFKEYFVAALPKDHPLATKTEVSIEDLKKYPNVITSDNPYYEEIMSNSSHNTVVVDEEIMMVPIISQGFAVGIMSGMFQYTIYRDIVILPLKEQYYRVIGIAIKQSNQLSKASTTFIEILREVVSKLHNETRKEAKLLRTY